MNALSLCLVLLVTFLTVFLESTVNFTRDWLGAQIDLLPALVVYAAMSNKPLLTTMIAVFGGIWFDSLSMNPLGLTVVPLMVAGMVILYCREVVLRDQLSAQVIIGMTVGAAVPLVEVLMLLTLGKAPLLGWGSLWQWLVMTVGCGVATPVVFLLFDMFEHWFSYQPMPETTFQHNREMKRGRH